MNGFDPHDVANVVGGSLKIQAEPLTARRVVIDSRITDPGDLFFAIEGPRHDGHCFIEDALDRGAVGVVARRPGHADRGWRVSVADTLVALQAIARARRLRFPVKVIAVTGSSGKTTTKNLLAHCLGGPRTGVGGEVIASRASYNNHVGVPLTMLRIGERTRHAVLEIGSSRPGEIGALAKIASPCLSVVTTVGESHLEGLGSVRGVAVEKGALVSALRPDGIAVLNRDCRWFRYLGSLHPGETLTYGYHEQATVRVQRVIGAARGISVRLRDPDGEESVLDVGLHGAHNAMNVAAAVAAARRLGVGMADIRARLRTFESPPMRMERLRFGPLLVYNDAYNSNPGSVRAAIRSFCSLHSSQAARRIAILGDMLELGDRSGELHSVLGGFAASSGLDLVLGVGGNMRATIDSARLEGLGAERARWFEDMDALIGELGAILRPDDAILLKGSRGGALERCVPAMQRIGEELGPVAASAS